MTITFESQDRRGDFNQLRLQQATRNARAIAARNPLGATGEQPKPRACLESDYEIGATAARALLGLPAPRPAHSKSTDVDSVKDHAATTGAPADARERAAGAAAARAVLRAAGVH